MRSVRPGRTLKVGALVALLVLASSGCDLMARISEGAYRTAVADGTRAELERRGIPTPDRPHCRTPGTGDASVVQVRCTGRTASGARVVVTGGADRADTDRPRESYTVTVDGRVVLRTACLGPACPAPSR
ncbi:hypothetical protein ACFY4C_37965 [Actinomadura viridis]|uniref:hypothetical protein n=1 Tax=Actinomadura viridis TaxID=58110 RepID=UPI0036A4639D